jgi:hypothetical protein
MPAQSLAGCQPVAATARKAVAEEEEASGASAVISAVASGTEARLGDVPGRGSNLANLTPSKQMLPIQVCTLNRNRVVFFSLIHKMRVFFLYKLIP